MFRINTSRDECYSLIIQFFGEICSSSCRRVQSEFQLTRFSERNIWMIVLSRVNIKEFDMLRYIKVYIFSLSNVPRIRKVSKESAFTIRIKPLPNSSLIYTLYIALTEDIDLSTIWWNVCGYQGKGKGQTLYGHPRSSVTVTLLRSDGNVRTVFIA